MFLRNKNRTALCVLRTARSKDAVRCTSYVVRKEDGFTLIEVLVAIVILATGLVLVIEGMARTQQAIRISENLMHATSLAEEKLIGMDLKVRNVKKMSLSRERGKLKIDGREFAFEETIGPYEDYTLKDQTRLNQASVDVLWQEGASRSNEFRLSSLIRNRDKKEEKIA